MSESDDDTRGPRWRNRRCEREYLDLAPDASIDAVLERVALLDGPGRAAYHLWVKPRHWWGAPHVTLSTEVQRDILEVLNDETAVLAADFRRDLENTLSLWSDDAQNACNTPTGGAPRKDLRRWMVANLAVAIQRGTRHLGLLSWDDQDLRFWISAARRGAAPHGGKEDLTHKDVPRRHWGRPDYWHTAELRFWIKECRTGTRPTERPLLWSIDDVLGVGDNFNELVEAGDDLDDLVRVGGDIDDFVVLHYGRNYLCPLLRLLLAVVGCKVPIDHDDLLQEVSPALQRPT